MLSRRSGIGAPVNISVVPLARRSSAMGERSSPSTTATRRGSPCSANSACSASRQACRFTPPAFTTTRMRRAAISAASGRITWVMKSPAKPASGDFAFIRDRIAMVTSAR